MTVPVVEITGTQVNLSASITETDRVRSPAEIGIVAPRKIDIVPRHGLTQAEEEGAHDCERESGKEKDPVYSDNCHGWPFFGIASGLNPNPVLQTFNPIQSYSMQIRDTDYTTKAGSDTRRYKIP